MNSLPLLTPAESGLPRVSRYWLETKDGDPHALALYRKHYSRHVYKDWRQPKLFCGPGQKMVLVTPCGKAFFVWRKFKSGDAQEGVNCAAFRNESLHQSSAMIVDAMGLAWKRWPGERLYTYVNPRKVHSANPGYCFLKAGWKRLKGRTKWNRLMIFEATDNLPEDAGRTATEGRR